jgi:hypothetical protein
MPVGPVLPVRTGRSETSVFLIIPVAPVFPGLLVAAVVPFVALFAANLVLLSLDFFIVNMCRKIVSWQTRRFRRLDYKNPDYFGLFPRFPPKQWISRLFTLFLQPF